MSNSQMTDYLDHMHVPKAYHSANVCTIPLPQSKVVKRYIENFKAYMPKGWGLMLWGGFGTGKTMGGVVLLKECVIKNNLTGLWILAEDLPKYAIEKPMFDQHMTMMERIQFVDLLVIDEVILHKGDKFTDTIVETVFRRRQANLKPTCITTNLTPTQFQENYPALASVMSETVYPVKFEGDFRTTLRKEMEKEFKS